jgi:hypothetical protein
MIAGQAPRAALPVEAEGSMPNWIARAATLLGQWWCGLRTGHTYLRQLAGNRLTLVCWQCDRKSPGWNLK